MNSLGERSQMIYYDCKRNIKTIKTRMGDSLFTVVKTYKDGNREVELYNYNKKLIRLEL